MYKSIIKRLLDILFSVILLVLLSPLFLLISILLFIEQKSSPFYIQQRPGRHTFIFNLYKFKTMNSKRDIEGQLLPDKERITKLGKILRTLSLDELPQLINIIKGDMSFIGPRPLLVRYLSFYNERQARRHNVRPGITGLAQISGRNQLSWTQKFEYDIYYIDNISFWLDIKIVFLTIVKILSRDGINQSDERTMEPFNG